MHHRRPFRVLFPLAPEGTWRASLLFSSLALAAACNAGQIGEPGGFPERSDDAKAQDGTSQATAGAAAPSGDNPVLQPAAPSGALDLAPSGLRKLTVEQYENSVRDLLGAHVQLPPDIELEADVAQNGFYAVAASNATLSPAATEKLEQAAYALAAQGLSSAHRAELVPCSPAAVTDSQCAEKFFKDFGRRAFRRPLAAAELTRYAKIADTAATTLGDFYQGLEFAIAAVLQSPNFLFRVELGEADPGNSTRLRYTGYELATRLSYALWNTTPDDKLLAAAESGELSDGLADEAARLLADSRAARALDNFH
ncbi:MAG TPA: DUF1595 domain-containing protein, partial [Polyangiales bacterium]|nr:DUF1595 domain-containing protein [Polyangiales bacterium]